LSFSSVWTTLVHHFGSKLQKIGTRLPPSEIFGTFENARISLLAAGAFNTSAGCYFMHMARQRSAQLGELSSQVTGLQKRLEIVKNQVSELENDHKDLEKRFNNLCPEIAADVTVETLLAGDAVLQSFLIDTDRFLSKARDVEKEVVDLKDAIQKTVQDVKDEKADAKGSARAAGMGVVGGTFLTGVAMCTPGPAGLLKTAAVVVNVAGVGANSVALCVEEQNREKCRKELENLKHIEDNLLPLLDSTSSMIKLAEGWRTDITERRQEIDEARKHLQAQHRAQQESLHAQNQRLLEERAQQETREKQLLEELSRLRASQRSVPHEDD